jgi:hypothetical protein
MDVKQAAETAADYLLTFFPDAERVRLEEIEISDDDKFWFITLSFLMKPSGKLDFIDERVFKVFKIDSEKGEVRSMKIRSLE